MVYLIPKNDERKLDLCYLKILSFKCVRVGCIFFPKTRCVYCACTARFVSDLVGNPEDRFSHNEAQMKKIIVLTEQEQRVAPEMHTWMTLSQFSDRRHYNMANDVDV